VANFVLIRNERGDVAMILFPFFVVIMVVAGLAATEFASYIVANQRVSYLAREASNLALTRCWDSIVKDQKAGSSTDPTKETRTCLNRARVKSDIVNQVANVSLKDFPSQGVIKIHIWTNNDPTIENPFYTLTIYNTLKNTQNFNVTSKFENPSTTNLNLWIRPLALDNHRIAIAEVFYAYKPITGLSKNPIIKFSMPKTIYENAIF
jgi:hypothetical protein